MGKPYAVEMAALAGTLDWAGRTDIVAYVQALMRTRASALVCVGSGGSLSACELMASLHRRFADRPARVATPLEFLQEGAASGEIPWFISSGGSNRDILNAFSAGARSEPRNIGVLCANSLSKLADAARACSYCDLIAFDLQSGRDGFLATNSLMAFCVLLVRAYRALFLQDDGLYVPTRLMQRLVAGDFTDADGDVDCLGSSKTIIVLYGASTRVGASDLESRFVETSLAAVQMSDYRNFAHGRHYWLAQHGDDSAVLALVGEEDRELATMTLAALPKHVRKVRFDLSAQWEEAQLEALAFSQRLVQQVGAERAIDPGRPGVPEFGHLLYELPYRLPEHATVLGRDAWTAAVISRKAGQSIERLHRLGTLEQWVNDLDSYKSKLENTPFGIVILDYDGTLVPASTRTAPPGQELIEQLLRLLDAGALIGVATGRGVSAGSALKQVVPQRHWSHVIVGYYNGADILSLAQGAPDGNATTCKELARVAHALQEHAELRLLAKQTVRPYQITLEPAKAIETMRLWRIANDVVQSLGIPGVRVVRSAHSADVLAPNASKRNVVDHMLTNRRDRAALCIGDCGYWPGNDYELLSHDYSLSVDEVSESADRCWNFAVPGARGVEVTLQYLKALVPATAGQFLLKLAL